MGQNVYEGMFLIDPAKSSGDWDTASQTVHAILQRNKAEVIASRPWEERALAYPVEGHKRGMYLLTYFKAEGAALSGIDHDCRLSEMVLRQLVLKVEPKLVDQLVAQAMATPEESGGDGAGEASPDDAT